MSRDFHHPLAGTVARAPRALPGFAIAREMLRGADVPEALLPIFFRAVSTFATRPEVTGVDIGVKLKDGETDADAGYCIRVHVRDKVAKRFVTAAHRVPERFEGLWTDVLQGEYIRHHANVVAQCSDRKLRLRTLQPGVSISHETGSAGTLGMFVRGVDAEAANVYVLSADHVLADTGNPNTGDVIVQPGREDGGSPGDGIAGLVRRSLIYDAAIALFVDDGTRVVTNRAAETSDVIAGFDFPVMGGILVKSGAASCVTQAEVDGIGLFEGLGPGMHLKPVAMDVDDVPIATGGDSGAVWYDPDTLRAVGLHVRGNGVPTPDEQFAIATSVVKLCAALRVEPVL